MTTGSPATVWQGPAGTVPVVNGNGNIFEEVQVATAAQTVFNLLTFQYTPGTHSIFVYRKSGGIGAQMLRRGVDYTETDNDTITLAAGATAGDLLAFIAIAINQLLTPPIANGMPSGGTAGQVLSKIDGSDYNVKWASIAALGTLLDAPRVNVASAATIDLTPQATVTRNIQITGNTEIDGFQITNGQLFVCKLQSALLIKNNAAVVTQSGQDIKGSANDTFILRATADNIVEIISYTRASLSNFVAAGACRLTKSGANILLSRSGGTQLNIAGANEIIPAAGITLAPAGLVVSTLYYIYAAMIAGVMTLEASVTGHVTDATTGVEVKNGDNTRTLVGMVRPIAGPAFQDAANQRFVVSYYNRKNIQTQASLVGAVGNSTAAGAFVELTATIRNEFLIWGDEACAFDFDGGVSHNVVGHVSIISIGLDGVVTESTSTYTATQITISEGVGCAVVLAPTEGYHYTTLMINLDVSGVFTATYSGGASAGARTSLKGIIRG